MGTSQLLPLSYVKMALNGHSERAEEQPVALGGRSWQNRRVGARLGGCFQLGHSQLHTGEPGARIDSIRETRSVPTIAYGFLGF